MVSLHDKWIRIYDIPETSKHKNGFTLYKIISMLYPEACPDAVTKVTVWKRFNDFKLLYKEIRSLHRKLALKTVLPKLPKGSLFKRFDEDTIEERKQSILLFLDFVSGHSQLFTSNVFVKFFEVSHTPVDHLKGNINLIRADLNLPKDTEFANSDQESDTDSISTFNSISPSVTESTEPVFLPSALESYITDAQIHVELAEELERDHKFEEAFTAYKAAIDIMIKYGKDETSYETKQTIRYKTEKCLIKAEKIYNMFLAPEVQNLRTEPVETKVPQKPLFDLFKYKVVRIVGNGMLVLHSESLKLFYIKVIHKTTQFLNEHLILPENVPYMVKLVNHYNSENALFLILEYCSGVSLTDFIQKRNKDELEIENLQMLKRIQELSDNESEHSFSELVSSYTNRNQADPSEDSDESDFVKVNYSDLKKKAENLMDAPLENPKPKPSLSRGSTSTDFELDCSNSAIPEQLAIKWSAQLLLALEKLHALGIICRDLQSANLIVDDNNDIVLTYKCNVKDLYDLYANGVNINLAPEVYSFNTVAEATDWWSFGAILYELLVGMPLSSVHPNGIMSYTHLKIPKYVSPEGRSILRQLLVYEANERLGYGPNGTDSLKTHPFFRNINFEELLSQKQAV